MRPEQISEALNHLPEDLVAETLSNRGKSKKRAPRWPMWTAAAACLVLVVGFLMWGGRDGKLPRTTDSDPLVLHRADQPNSESHEDIHYAPTMGTDVVPTPSKHLMFSPQYPQMPTLPENVWDWDKRKQWLWELDTLYEPVKEFQIPEGFMNFYRNTAQTFLADPQGENATYSPLNLYLALSMLAEVTGGSTRQEILALLDAKTIEAVRGNAAAFWLSNYSDNEILTCKLGNSIWLRGDMTYEENTLTTLAEIYYTASYSGTMGSEEINHDLQNWINDHTGGLLQEPVGELGFDENVVVALVSALSFEAQWENGFNAQLTENRIFCGSEAAVTMEFLHSERNDTLYYGDNFTACKLPMSQGTAMWFFLPDEGVSPQELLEQDTLYSLTSYDTGAYEQEIELSLYLPKFDITAKTNMTEGLKQMGLTEVFDSMESDFTPLTRDASQIFLSKAEHCARVRIDEDGCEAGAYIILDLPMEAIPPELDRVELVFDRPFVFVITGRTDHPLFIGIVDQP